MGAGGYAGRIRAVWCLLLALAGCASTPPLLTPTPQADAPFALSGRVAVRQGQQHDTAGLRWTHAARDEILLQGPLGYTAARIRRDAQGATLEDAYGRRYQAADAEALMQQALGWSVPLVGLPYWLQGRAAPQGEARAERNEAGQIVALYQQGWEVRFLKYAGAQRDALPLHIELQRDGLQVVLHIDQWQAP
ncbi:MAG: lipoprotein insertase outer membrane protein LolB [Sideroxydans sp.]